MARIIKAPNVHEDRKFTVVERDKVIRFAEDEAEEIIRSARRQEEILLQNASLQANEILENAARDAEEIIAQAHTEAEAIKEESRNFGYNEGLNQGLEDARKQAAGILNDLRAMLNQGRQILHNLFLDQEQEIRKLVSEILTRVVQLNIEQDDEIVVRVAMECIRMAADRQSLRLLIHPDDKARIEEWVPEFTRRFDDIEKISVDVDPRVGCGGIIIESGAGGVDGRIDKQLEILNDTLLHS